SLSSLTTQLYLYYTDILKQLPTTTFLNVCLLLTTIDNNRSNILERFVAMFYIKKAFYTLLFFIIILIVSLSIILSFGPPSIQLESNVFLDDNNHVIHDENIQYDQLPKQLIQATIAAEDKQFFKHHGFDFKGIGRALFKN